MVRLLSGLAYLAIATQTIQGASIPDANDALSIRADTSPRSDYIMSPDHTLERRKGGGGRGSSSSGSSSGSRGSSGSSGSSSRTSSTSNVGGATRLGSGPPRSFGRGGYYGGGAAVPYTAGSPTKRGLPAGALIAPAAVLAIMPGLWLYSVYPYHFSNPYRFRNRTANHTSDNDNDRRDMDMVNLMIRQDQDSQGANETLPVVCLCQENFVCGCEENTDDAYINDLVGNGSYAALNKSVVTVSDYEGEKHLVLNGTLPMGTTAPGGQDDAASALAVGKYAGYWAVGLFVVYGVFM